MNDNYNGAAAVGRKSIGAVAVIVAGLAMTDAASGQRSDSLIVDVGRCVHLASPGERLDCYEEQVRRAQARSPTQGASPAPAASPAPRGAPGASPPAPAAAAPSARPPAETAAPPSASPAAPAAQAGERPVRVENARVANARVPNDSSSGERRRRRGDDDERAASDGSAAELTLDGTITALRETVPNSWLITLDNGQLWRQSYAKWYPLQVGQRVQIAPGRFGSHRLTAIGVNGNIQVEPVR